MSGAGNIVTARKGIFILTSFLQQYLDFSCLFPQDPDMRGTVPQSLLMRSCPFCCFPGRYSIFIYDIKTGLLSILGTYFQGIILDHFLFGFSIKKKVCVVSDHIEEIRDYVINVMHSGATFYEATGAYDYRRYKELNIIVNRQEYVTLINLIDKVDPDAFVSVYNVSEIMSHTWGRKGGSQNASGK